MLIFPQKVFVCSCLGAFRAEWSHLISKMNVLYLCFVIVYISKIPKWFVRCCGFRQVYLSLAIDQSFSGPIEETLANEGKYIHSQLLIIYPYVAIYILINIINIQICTRNKNIISTLWNYIKRTYDITLKTKQNCLHFMECTLQCRH